MVPMRPNLSGSLESRIKRAVEIHGYDTPTELVRGATRRRLEELEKHEEYL